MRRARRSWLAVAGFLTIASLIVVRTLTHLNVPGQPAAARYGMHDFRDAIYFPTVSFLEGRNPYDGRDLLATYPVARPFAPYTPISFAVHLPFAALPYEAAEVLYLATGVVLSLAVAWLALRLCGLVPRVAGLFAVAALLLLTRPAHMTLFIGQPALLLTAATYAALLHGRSRPGLAGVALAVTCLKPTWGGPLGLLMLARRDVRAVAVGWGLAAIVGGALAVPVVETAGGPGPFLQSLRGSYALLALDRAANAASSNLRLDALGFVGRLLGRSIDASGVALSVLLLGLGALGCRRFGRAERLASSSLACVTMLTCTYHQVYDAVILTLPALALATGRLRLAGGRRGVALRWGLLAGVAVPAFNYVSTATALRALGIHGTSWWLVVTSLNGACVVAIFLAFVACAVRARPAPAPIIDGVAAAV
jgi:hypothetical protein